MPQSGEAAHDLAAELGGHLDYWRDVRRRLQACVHQPTQSSVHWISGGGRFRAAWLNAAPIESAGMLRERLFAAPEARILVSATLAIGGSFEYVKRRLGLEDARCATRWARRSTTLAPRCCTCPTTCLIRPSPATRSSSSARFSTSSARLQRAHAGAVHQSRAPEGDLSGAARRRSPRRASRCWRRASTKARARACWRRFAAVRAWCCSGPTRSGKASTSSATRSAASWSRGCRSRCRPTRSTPRAPSSSTIRLRSTPCRRRCCGLKQGFGRLIRSRADRGAVVVLDRRLVTRFYGQVFVRSLPPCSVKQGPGARAGARSRELAASARARTAAACASLRRARRDVSRIERRGCHAVVRHVDARAQHPLRLLGAPRRWRAATASG